jgi:23S rRNA (pseudouridine1915-N3)-methyltransferase
MKLRIIAAGTRMPAWVNDGTLEYARRLPREYHLDIVEIPLASAKRGVTRALQEEGARMLAVLGARDRVVALAIEGQRLSTTELARRLDQWQQDGRDVAFLIGGPEGLASACLERAELRWSLSPLTFPHALVRVLLVEQLYRAWTVLRGHPYHREGRSQL